MERLLLIDAERTGNRVVAVGDRGYIVFSDDNGESWKRAKAPESPLLTALYFLDQKQGWAVGHDSMVVATTDGGENWAKQFSAPSEQRPLLDVLFLTKDVGFAVGAYGAYYETTDGGKTWNARKILEAPKAAPAPAKTAKGIKGKDSEPAEPARDGGDDKGDEDRHLNAIIQLAENQLLIVGEAGTLLRSDDAGKTWNKLTPPYKGSFFGAIKTDDNALVTFGLRGRIYRSADLGKSWTQVDNNSVATLMGATKLPDGTLVIAGASGTVLVSRDNGLSFSALATKTTKAFSKPLLGAPNAVLLLGEAGARDVLIPSAKR